MEGNTGPRISVKQRGLRAAVFLGIIATGLIFFSGAAQAQKMNISPSDGAEVQPNTQLNNDQLAARFLDQASAGATPQDVASLSAALAAHPDTAFSDWLNAQYAKPVQDSDLSLTIFRSMYDNQTAKASYHYHANEAAEVRASLMISDNNNELRRQVAYALSQIFVVSDQDNPLEQFGEGMCDWYDLLYKDAFTDFHTILTDVTYHPAMSDFLSDAGNAKAGFFNKNSRPDENYAREVMQLFTIGLVQLNLDGTQQVDGEGHAIPTYTQDEIPEVARVFTGLMYPKGDVFTGVKGGNATTPLKRVQGQVRFGRDVIDERRHDTGEKSFLGHTLPAGQNTDKDIADTLDILCNHQNCAPFFAKGMIQRMVTSNPSPAYVRRVAQAFLDNKGDMKAVITAILLDPEARDPKFAHKEDYGKLREPFLRVTQLARAFQAIPVTPQSPSIYPASDPMVPLIPVPYPLREKEMLMRIGQYPTAAPSVFNFYLPNYQSPGIVSERNKNATDAMTLTVDPEFQIMNSNTALLLPNMIMDSLKADPLDARKRGNLCFDLTTQINLANDPAALVDNVTTLLTGGTISDHSRQVITDAVGKLLPTTDPEVLKERARMAIYLTMISPDYAIQK
jgi:uncharacterized protein (DUF1800 family)